MKKLLIRCTIPGQNPLDIPVHQERLVIGSLSSNQVALHNSGAEPIHALLERHQDETFTLTDLGSGAGVIVDGKPIDVHTVVKLGQTIHIGQARLSILEDIPTPLPAPPPPPLQSTPPTMRTSAPSPRPASPSVAPSTSSSTSSSASVAAPLSAPRPPEVKSPQPRIGKTSAEEEPTLFAPQAANAAGDVLEVVSYWGNRVLAVEHFGDHAEKRVLIGESPSDHFIAGGNHPVKNYPLAVLSKEGVVLKLSQDMSARLRLRSTIQNVTGGTYTLGQKDFALVTFGAVKYFLVYMRPPSLILPKKGPRDPFFLSILFMFMAMYFAFSAIILIVEPKAKDKFDEDIWSVVHVPEREKPKAKPENKIVEAKKIAPPPPPPPPPPKVEPAKEAAVKPIEKPVPPPPPEAPKAAESLANKAQPKPETAEGVAKPKDSNANRGGQGNNAPGGARAGTQNADAKGAADVNNQKASGVNLSNLGLGVGAVKSFGGIGGITTNFKNSAGGAGGGMGSQQKTLGLGGIGDQKTLGLAGSSKVAGSFGSGDGSLLSGKEGKGLGNEFGRGHKNSDVNVRAADPLVSGGLTQEEIMAVIRANLTPIRHCYEQLLQRVPEATGQIKVKFVIGLDGIIKSTQVTDSQIPDKGMQDCLTKVITRWQFPDPRGESAVTVNSPFVFNPL